MIERPAPLHAQVERARRERLDSRDLRPGDLFPSEAALQAEFEVSRSVVRQALATLEAEGLIRKVRGKGSVVAEHREVHRDVRRSGLRLEADSAGGVTTAVDAYDVVGPELRPSDTILLKASRGDQMERWLPLLERDFGGEAGKF